MHTDNIVVIFYPQRTLVVQETCYSSVAMEEYVAINIFSLFGL
jgi:hypothetical protein